MKPGHLSGDPTDDNMQKWGYQKRSKCPWCNHPVENVKHMICCPCQEATITWDHDLLQILNRLMVRMKTALSLRHTIITILCS